jgi:mono/diheme cytochrome c family protein
MKSVLWLVVVTAMVSACGGSGDRAADASAPGVHGDSVALATEQLTAATFDTVVWQSDSAAVARGGVVWTYSCRRCHGDYGRGDGRFVMAGDTIRPPSLVGPGWRFAGDHEGMRQVIFTGTAEGMPHWGVVGLKPRDVDAVATYISTVIRRE